MAVMLSPISRDQIMSSFKTKELDSARSGSSQRQHNCNDSCCPRILQCGMIFYRQFATLVTITQGDHSNKSLLLTLIT